MEKHFCCCYLDVVVIWETLNTLKKTNLSHNSSMAKVYYFDTLPRTPNVRPKFVLCFVCKFWNMKQNMTNKKSMGRPTGNPRYVNGILLYTLVFVNMSTEMLKMILLFFFFRVAVFENVFSRFFSPSQDLVQIDLKKQ